MNIDAEQRLQRQAAAVQRHCASRKRLRGRLITKKPASGFMVRLAGLGEHLASLVQRHPGVSAGGAVVLGALLMRARPWRWALSTGIWALLVPRVLPTLVAALTAPRSAHVGARGAPRTTPAPLTPAPTPAP